MPNIRKIIEEILIILNPPVCIKSKRKNCPNVVKLVSIETVAKPVTQTPLKDKNIASIKDKFPQQAETKLFLLINKETKKLQKSF